MRALVTGSAGFVGRHIAAELIDRRWDVHGVDIVHGQDCLDLFRQGIERYDLAIHCAAIVGGRESIDGSPLDVATNLALDAHYMRWLLRSHTPRAVYFSSSAAYPTALQRAPGRLLHEDDITLHAAVIGRPDQTYGLVKIVGETLAQEVQAEGCHLVVARPFSGYGPDQDPVYPFPAYIARALAAGPAFDVWGDGSQTRDFIHIDDVVAAVLTAVDDDFRLPVNLGTGRSTSFDELARLVCAQLGYEPNIRHDTTKPTGPSHRVADVTRMHELYVPKVSLEYGITEALHAKRAA